MESISLLVVLFYWLIILVYVLNHDIFKMRKGNKEGNGCIEISLEENASDIQLLVSL